MQSPDRESRCGSGSSVNYTSLLLLVIFRIRGYSRQIQEDWLERWQWWQSAERKGRGHGIVVQGDPGPLGFHHATAPQAYSGAGAGSDGLVGAWVAMHKEMLGIEAGPREVDVEMAHEGTAKDGLLVVAPAVSQARTGSCHTTRAQSGPLSRPAQAVLQLG